MPNLYDIAYAFAAGASAPVWFLKSSARRKVLGAFADRMGQIPTRTGEAPAAMIHAVSLGEVNATRGLVDRLRQLRPDLHIIISTTTETGFTRARELYGSALGTQHSALSLVRYPLDFTSAITRTLDALRPDVIVLMELEVWPNFLLQCSRRRIPVIVVNGRMTAPSFRRYRLARPFIRRMFSRLSAVCVQDQTYASRFEALGVAHDKIQVTGTMKFDTATVADDVDGADQLAADLALPQHCALSTQHSALGTPHSLSTPLWVCGSTGPGEERIVLEIYRSILPDHPGLRLAIIPRHPQRFDEVAKLIASAGFPLIRRSQRKIPIPEPESRNPSPPSRPRIILGDTMGELRKFYGLADAILVGRTLVDLGARQHGSDMIEPAALGRPVIVGPFTDNFAEAMSRFRAAAAIIEVQNPLQLLQTMQNLLADPAPAIEMARRARQVVLNEKGATERHVQVALAHLDKRISAHASPGT